MEDPEVFMILESISTNALEKHIGEVNLKTLLKIADHYKLGPKGKCSFFDNVLRHKSPISYSKKVLEIGNHQLKRLLVDTSYFLDMINFSKISPLDPRLRVSKEVVQICRTHEKLGLDARNKKLPNLLEFLKENSVREYYKVKSSSEKLKKIERSKVVSLSQIKEEEKMKRRFGKGKGNSVYKGEFCKVYFEEKKKERELIGLSINKTYKDILFEANGFDKLPEILSKVENKGREKIREETIKVVASTLILKSIERNTEEKNKRKEHLDSLKGKASSSTSEREGKMKAKGCWKGKAEKNEEKVFNGSKTGKKITSLIKGKGGNYNFYSPLLKFKEKEENKETIEKLYVAVPELKPRIEKVEIAKTKNKMKKIARIEEEERKKEKKRIDIERANKEKEEREREEREMREKKDQEELIRHQKMEELKESMTNYGEIGWLFKELKLECTDEWKRFGKFRSNLHTRRGLEGLINYVSRDTSGNAGSRKEAIESLKYHLKYNKKTMPK